MELFKAAFEIGLGLGCGLLALMALITVGVAAAGFVRGLTEKGDDVEDGI